MLESHHGEFVYIGCLEIEVQEAVWPVIHGAAVDLFHHFARNERAHRLKDSFQLAFGPKFPYTQESKLSPHLGRHSGPKAS